MEADPEELALINQEYRARIKGTFAAHRAYYSQPHYIHLWEEDRLHTICGFTKEGLLPERALGGVYFQCQDCFKAYREGYDGQPPATEAEAALLEVFFPNA